MNAQELDDRLEAAIPIVRAAGRLALDYFNDRGALAIEHKGQQDLVSIADRAVEELIRAELAKPCSRATRCWARRAAGAAMRARTWVLDPIDGTFNFLKGIPCWGVVAAYVVDGRDRDRPDLRPGPRRAVRRPARRGCVPQRCGRSGSRATRASTRPAWRSPTASASRKASYVAMVDARAGDGFEHRRAGSTAMQLCWVADGRCDGFATLYCSSWDALAGLILVEEAGGLATRLRRATTACSARAAWSPRRRRWRRRSRR